MTSDQYCVCKLHSSVVYVGYSATLLHGHANSVSKISLYIVYKRNVESTCNIYKGPHVSHGSWIDFIKTLLLSISRAYHSGSGHHIMVLAIEMEYGYLESVAMPAIELYWTTLVAARSAGGRPSNTQLQCDWSVQYLDI